MLSLLPQLPVIDYTELLPIKSIYIALVFCEVRSVNFLKTFIYIRKTCLEVNRKQLTKVGIESDR